MDQTLRLANLATLEQLGQRLATQLCVPSCVLLQGDLGAGKTSLARAMIGTLLNEPEAEVPSPTFTLLQTYDAPNGVIYHYDLYRLKQAEEVYELDWEAAMAEAIVLVEWPERLGRLQPHDAKIVRLETTGESRRAYLSGFSHVDL